MLGVSLADPESVVADEEVPSVAMSEISTETQD